MARVGIPKSEKNEKWPLIITILVIRFLCKVHTREESVIIFNIQTQLMEPAPYLMQKASFCEDSFWEARGKSRRNLISAVVISSILLQLLDVDHAEIVILSLIYI
jgi:hypothetical protein